MVQIWLWIGDKYFLNDKTIPWLPRSPDLGKSGSLYMTVFYWVTQILATVGFGDIPILTNAEYLVSWGMEYFGVVMFTVLKMLVD